MRYLSIVTGILISAHSFSGVVEIPKAQQEVLKDMQINMGFVENRGQVSNHEGATCNDIKFSYSTKDLSLFFKNNSISYVFNHKAIIKDESFSKAPRTVYEENIEFTRVDLEFIDANPTVQIRTGNSLATRSNFIKGTSSVYEVQGYEYLLYENLYPGIDLKYYFNKKGLKYDFIVHPGADPDNIKFKYNGANHIELHNKEIFIHSSLGTIKENKPYSYSGDPKNEVPSCFMYDSTSGIISFNTGDYDNKKSLIIDPQLVWCTYMGADNGGAFNDRFDAITVDKSGNIYLIGRNASGNFPVSNPGGMVSYNGTYNGGNGDVIIVKFNASHQLQWASYFGGNKDEWGLAINVDNNGSIYIAGQTYSTGGFPVLGPGASAYSQSACASCTTYPDAFIAKLSPSGKLVWSTFYGGSSYDEFIDLAIEPSGKLLVLGNSRSNDFPLQSRTGAYNQTMPAGSSWHGVILQFDTATCERLWSTTYSGNTNSDDPLHSLDVDASGNIYISGHSDNALWPTLNPMGGAYFQGTKTGRDATILKMNSSGQPVWATFFGGPQNFLDHGYSLSVQLDGNLYMLLDVGSPDMPTADPGNCAYKDVTKNGTSDMFIAHFDPNCKYIWGTYYGGDGMEGYPQIACNDEYVYIFFYTESETGLSTLDAGNGAFYDNAIDPSWKHDLFISRFTKEGRRLWATYFGGDSHESGMNSKSLFLKDNDVYICGAANSTANFPWVNDGGYFDNSTNNDDAFVAHFKSIDLNNNLFSVTTDTNICKGECINFDFKGSTSGKTFQWTFQGASTSTSINADPTNICYNSAGIFDVKLVVDQGGCKDTITKQTYIKVNEVNVSLTPSKSTTICSGDSLNLIATGGTTYSWSPASGLNITNTSSVKATPVTSVIYTVTVTDSNNCTAVDSISINVSTKTNAQVSAAGPFCSNDNAVTLTVSENGGAWSGQGITNISAGIFDPATAGSGTHTIYYTIAGKCGNTDSIDIVVNNQPDATISPAGPYCTSDPIVTLIGASAGGSWLGTGITNTSTGTFDPATAGNGTHKIIYSFSGVCPDKDSISILVSGKLNASISTVSPLCTSDSILTLNGGDKGGTWSGTGVTNADSGYFDPTIAGAGTHKIIYTIGGNCGDKDSIDIIVNFAPDADITSAGSTYCLSDPEDTLTAVSPGGIWTGTGISNSSLGIFDPSIAGNGSHQIIYSFSGVCPDADTIQIIVSTAFDATIHSIPNMCTGDAPVDLTAADPGGLWSGTGIIDTILGTFDPFIADSGSHKIIYYIAGSCGDIDSIYITVSPSANASITPFGPLCLKDAAVNLNTASGGGTWNGTGISSGTFDPAMAGAGIHTIIYTINSSCGDSDTLEVEVKGLFNASINASGPYCVSNTPVVLTAVDPGGTWSGNGITNSSAGIFNPSTAGLGSHQVIYTIPGSCGNADTISILVKGKLDASISEAGPFCPNDTLIQLNAADSGGIWYGPGLSGPSGLFNPGNAGNGTHTITYLISGSCGDTAIASITVLNNPIADAGEDQSVQQGNSVTINATGGTTFNWTPSTGLSCSNCVSPTATPTATTTYYVEVIDANGCISRDSVTISVEDPCGKLFVPTAFSPNNDNMNDVLYVRGTCVESLAFKLYDRWGTLVFSTSDITQGWDGKHDGKMMANNVLTYYLVATLISGEEISQQGNISLIR